MGWASLRDPTRLSLRFILTPPLLLLLALSLVPDLPSVLSWRPNIFAALNLARINYGMQAG